ncbi:hypothetical protein CRG98_040901 [Punica granatum]|uniref:Retrotransposon gag domain-containing protein n=1 Tax=Punica granatum TaxID=22663 RepID=A0A2I0I4V3_PUNGR|nr:hypothetical protein CRG98_040901 [Punica granatum]
MALGRAWISRLKQEGSGIRDYYGKLKLLWDELEFYLEHPSCSCGARATIIAQRETEKTYQFLMGLTSEFNTIRSTILSIEPMPSLNKVYNMVANEERQRIVARLRESIPESAVFAAREKTETLERGNSRASWQNPEGKNSCTYCGKLGHARQSPGSRWKAQNPRGPDRANAVQTGQGSGSRAERLEALPDEQFNRLLSMLSQDTVDSNRLIGPHLEEDTWSGSRRGLLSKASGYRTVIMSGSHGGIRRHLASKARSSVSTTKVKWYRFKFWRQK